VNLFAPQTIGVYHSSYGPSTFQKGSRSGARSRPAAVVAGLCLAPRPVSAAFAQAGEALTPGEFGLMVLVERNAGLSQTALARALDIDRSTLVPILDRLQGRELLVRRPSPTDGRTHALVLTPLGTRTLAQFSRLVRSHERRIARGLSSDEMHLLIALLEKVRAGVSPL